jgi:hypothetical protein
MEGPYKICVSFGVFFFYLMFIALFQYHLIGIFCLTIIKEEYKSQGSLLRFYFTFFGYLTTLSVSRIYSVE